MRFNHHPFSVRFYLKVASALPDGGHGSGGFSMAALASLVLAPGLVLLRPGSALHPRLQRAPGPPLATAPAVRVWSSFSRSPRFPSAEGSLAARSRERRGPSQPQTPEPRPGFRAHPWVRGGGCRRPPVGVRGSAVASITPCGFPPARMAAHRSLVALRDFPFSAVFLWFGVFWLFLKILIISLGPWGNGQPLLSPSSVSPLLS